ncbi:hypothetical protein EUTSA_v10027072mg [Eutrema salsugineum]|uniref:Uncharacterized protein n=1 Tax=Eutrema salsugineum TaxID=72664 RepID=V4LTZ8_EUTSA|nr:hypothetical protein EUTSA_v10027072mg [Eutrema salsugineum]
MAFYCLSQSLKEKKKKYNFYEPILPDEVDDTVSSPRVSVILAIIFFLRSFPVIFPPRHFFASWFWSTIFSS